MVEVVVSFAVEKLANFLNQKIALRQSVKINVEWLKNELSYMRSFIKDAEETQYNDHRVRQWVSEIEDIADDTVIIMQDFSRKIEDDGNGGVVHRLKMCACFFYKEINLQKLGQEMESLKERVLDISRKRETYGIKNLCDAGKADSNLRTTSRTIRRSTSYADEDQLFVGFEDVTEKLTNELLTGEPRRSVVSIVGMGGLGKTTVARKLYNSSLLLHNFRFRAWVCVSQEYSVLDLLQTILKSFKKDFDKKELEALAKMNVEDLEHEIRKVLKDQRYLIVVDDVWNSEAWQSLKRALPDHQNGSRIIVTTRNKNIAIKTDEKCFVHELRFLTEEESWDLFCKKLSWGANYTDWCSVSMVDLGREMVNKCGGLPLAILVLGGLLSHKNRLEDWLRVKDHLWRKMKNNSTEVDPLLSLSYDDLSPELKRCFLYLGMFPEDHLISTEKLMWLWIAEDFIPAEERAEDIAEDYLNELIDRSLIQVAKKFWGKTFKCRIHDLLRDLAVEKAKEVSLFDIFDSHKCTALSSGKRHAIHSDIEKYLSLGSLPQRTRSMLFFNPDHEKVKTGLFESTFQRFMLLRVLDLEDVHFRFQRTSSDFLRCIENFVHLKYLGLTNTNIDKLPKSIGKLKSLQILEAMFTKYALCYSSPKLSKLTDLRHIFCRLGGDLNVANMANLRSLKYVKFEQWRKVDTRNLVKLEELAIEEIYANYSLDNIGKLRNLRNLFLGCSTLADFPSLTPLSSCQSLLKLRLGGRIENQSWLEHLPQSLTDLNMYGSRLREDPMPILGRLKNLKSLVLSDCYDLKEIVCSAKSFPQLELLRLFDLPSLESWHLENGALPVLRCLELYECPMLKMIPERFKSLAVFKLKKFKNKMEDIRIPYPEFI